MSTSRPRTGRLAACALLLTPLLGMPGNAGAAAPPACETVLVSPAFQRDRIVACVYWVSTDMPQALAVSRDAGRSWRTPAMTGLVSPLGVAGTGLSVAFSPLFDADGTLFATTSSGTFSSTDLGESFTPLDPLARGGGAANPTAFLMAPAMLPVVGGDARPRVHLAYASEIAPAVIDVAAKGHQPVTGVPGLGALQFVVVPAAKGKPASVFAVVHETTGADQTVVVFRCDATFTCAERQFAFPSELRLGERRFQVLADGSVVAVLRSSDTLEVWRSTDGGRTFAEWRPVRKLLAPLNAWEGQPPTASFATSTAFPRRVYLRVEAHRPPTDWPKGAPPASQIFRSDDGGATWRRIAYARAFSQRGPHGNAPWFGPGSSAIHVQVAPDGRLFAPGRTHDAITTFCSVDGGRRWTAGCR